MCVFVPECCGSLICFRDGAQWCSGGTEAFVHSNRRVVKALLVMLSCKHTVLGREGTFFVPWITPIWYSHMTSCTLRPIQFATSQKYYIQTGTVLVVIYPEPNAFITFVWYRDIYTLTERTASLPKCRVIFLAVTLFSDEDNNHS